MYKAIMLPIDVSHESSWKKAIPLAKQLCETFGAKLHVMTVIQDIRTGMVAQYFPEDYEHEMAQKAAEKLSQIVAEQLPGLNVTEHISTGQVYREIVLAAKKHGCDLIVMASHRPELTDLLISPNSAHVVRHSEASVMVVR